jgi:hypothetical protein
VTDPSAGDPSDPELQGTCDADVITNADPDGGVPENHPNTRYVYASPCTTMYEVRIYDPSSDSARVTVTCASEGE